MGVLIAVAPYKPNDDSLSLNRMLNHSEFSSYGLRFGGRTDLFRAYEEGLLVMLVTSPDNARISCRR